MILGLDISSKNFGWALFRERNEEYFYYDSGVSISKHRDPIDRLEELSQMMKNLISRQASISHSVIERPVFVKNIRGTMSMLLVQGALCYVLRSNGISVDFIDNRKWKDLLMGKGNAAKEEIREFIELYCEIEPKTVYMDESDAIGIALAYLSPALEERIYSDIA